MSSRTCFGRCMIVVWTSVSGSFRVGEICNKTFAPLFKSDDSWRFYFIRSQMLKAAWHSSVHLCWFDLNLKYFARQLVWLFKCICAANWVYCVALKSLLGTVGVPKRRCWAGYFWVCDFEMVIRLKNTSVWCVVRLTLVENALGFPACHTRLWRWDTHMSVGCLD